MAIEFKNIPILKIIVQIGDIFSYGLNNYDFNANITKICISSQIFDLYKQISKIRFDSNYEAIITYIPGWNNEYDRESIKHFLTLIAECSPERLIPIIKLCMLYDRIDLIIAILNIIPRSQDRPVNGIK